MNSIYNLLLALVFALVSLNVKAQFGVNNVALSPAFPSPCDSITFTITGDHDQANITNYWLTDTLRNDTLIFTVHAVIPPMSVGGLTPFSFSPTLPPLPQDTFIIYAHYVASIPTFPPNSVTDTLIIDTILQVDAGVDTSFCNGNFIKLNALQPPPGMSGSWSVSLGSATLNSNTIHDPIVSNMSYGENIFIWSIPGNSCLQGGSDTVVWLNSEEPSPAIAEPDFFSCDDSTIIHASYVSVGSSTWQVISGSSLISNLSDSIAFVTNLSQGNNKFSWTVSDTNGICSDNYDELEVEYRKTGSVSIIRVFDTLLAGTAPNYQWYRNNMPLVGDTNQKLLIVQNGNYKVQTNADGCDNGPFSNEIEVTDIVGVNEFDQSSYKIYPNPTHSTLIIEGQFKDEESPHVEILNLEGQVVMNFESTLINDRMLLDVHLLRAGLYILRIGTSNRLSRHLFQKN